VLTGTQRIGGKIRAGAVIIAGLFTANRDAISAVALWVGQLEIGKDRFIAEIFEPEFLLASELSPKLDLPILQGHIFRTMGAGELGRRLPATAGRFARPC
jgi:hypothetical protein